MVDLALIEQAASTPRKEVAGRIGDSMDVVAYFDDAGATLELWVAVSKKDRSGSFVSAERILAVFGIFEQAVDAQLSEEPENWPAARDLEWFEVARLFVA